MIVIDASVAAVWLFDDESEALAETVLTMLASQECYAPVLWQYEIRNLLLTGVRRSRIDEDIMVERLNAVESLPILIDREAQLDVATSLAQRHALSFYDALYLELALRRNAGLATLDKALLSAARAEGAVFQANQNI